MWTKFYQVAKIKESLSDAALENLIAIFVPANRQSILLVYIGNPPPQKSDGHRVISLTDLPQQRLLDFADYLIISFSALDILRSDIPTMGMRFLPLEDILRERGLHTTLARTQTLLARHLHSSLSPESTASVRKFLRLQLASMLPEIDSENLLAALPPKNFQLLTDTAAWQFFYNNPNEPNDIQHLKLDDNTWVIGLEEIQIFYPDVTFGEHFLDLRSVLCSVGATYTLADTSRRLAERLQKYPDDFEAIKLRLRLESMLIDEDLDDLLAIIPHQNFWHTHNATRIYRRLVEQKNTRMAVFSIQHTLPASSLQNGQRRMAFALIPQQFFRFDGEVQIQWEDLNLVLLHIGRVHTLTRSQWLVVQDYIARKNDSPPAEILAAMMTRAITMLGVISPWKWRQGRAQQYETQCYQLLQKILRRLASESKAFSEYFHLLNLWYDSYIAPDIGVQLERMLHRARVFLRQTDDAEQTSTLETYRRNARQLVEVAEIALYPLGTSTTFLKNSGFQLDAFPITDDFYVQRLVKTNPSADNIPAELFSPFFKYWHDMFMSLRAEHHLLANQPPGGDVLYQLKKLLATLKHHKTYFFALPHEKKILDFVYDQEIDELNKIINRQEKLPNLHITLKNLWIDSQTDLHFEIKNIGQVAARDVGCVLEQTNDFELEGGSPIRDFLTLQPQETVTVKYLIRPVQPDVRLTLICNYRDEDSQNPYRAVSTFTPEVRNLQPIAFKEKVNHYEFGRPIQSPYDFFGRRQLLLDILSLLKAGGRQNILLRGPRRMGKTSLLYMLRHALNTVEVRRHFDVPTDWDPALNRIQPVFVTLQSMDMSSGDAPVHQFFRVLLEKIAQGIGYSIAEARQVSDAYAARSAQVGAANAAQEQLNRVLSTRPQQHIAVLLDEYDEVYRPAGGDLDTALRTLVSSELRLTWIIASTLMLYKESKSVGSPWFNIFLIEELGLLSPKAAESLVQMPSKNELVHWRSDTIVSLLEKTGRHPAFIQLFCSKLITELNHERMNDVLPRHISTVAEQIISEQETAHSHFEFYWSDIESIGKLILLTLARSTLPLSRDDIRRQVFNALSDSFGNLPAQSVVDSTVHDLMGNRVEWRQLHFRSGMDWADKVSGAIILNRRKRYQFAVPLFRDWLERRGYKTLWAETMSAIDAELKGYRSEK